MIELRQGVALIKLFETAEGRGLGIGEEEGELNLDRLHLGLQDGLVDFLAGLMAESVFDGELLVQDVAGNAQLAGGSGDLDAIEIIDAGGDLLDELLRGFDLCFGVRLRHSGVLRLQVREGTDDQHGGGKGA